MEHGVATPEAWKPGEQVIVPPPQTAEAAEKRSGEGFDYTDWYFSKKSL
jgi:peroxiredoxin 2/4